MAGGWMLALQLAARIRDAPEKKWAPPGPASASSPLPSASGIFGHSFPLSPHLPPASVPAPCESSPSRCTPSGASDSSSEGAPRGSSKRAGRGPSQAQGTWEGSSAMRLLKGIVGPSREKQPEAAALLGSKEDSGSSLPEVRAAGGTEGSWTTLPHFPPSAEPCPQSPAALKRWHTAGRPLAHGPADGVFPRPTACCSPGEGIGEGDGAAALWALRRSQSTSRIKAQGVNGPSPVAWQLQEANVNPTSPDVNVNVPPAEDLCRLQEVKSIPVMPSSDDLSDIVAAAAASLTARALPPSRLESTAASPMVMPTQHASSAGVQVCQAGGPADVELPTDLADIVAAAAASMSTPSTSPSTPGVAPSQHPQGPIPPLVRAASSSTASSSSPDLPEAHTHHSSSTTHAFTQSPQAMPASAILTEAEASFRDALFRAIDLLTAQQQGVPGPRSKSTANTVQSTGDTFNNSAQQPGGLAHPSRQLAPSAASAGSAPGTPRSAHINAVDVPALQQLAVASPAGSSVGTPRGHNPPLSPLGREARRSINFPQESTDQKQTRAIGGAGHAQQSWGVEAILEPATPVLSLPAAALPSLPTPGNIVVTHGADLAFPASDFILGQEPSFMISPSDEDGTGGDGNDGKGCADPAVPTSCARNEEQHPQNEEMVVKVAASGVDAAAAAAPYDALSLVPTSKHAGPDPDAEMLIGASEMDWAEDLLFEFAPEAEGQGQAESTAGTSVASGEKEADSEETATGGSPASSEALQLPETDLTDGGYGSEKMNHELLGESSVNFLKSLAKPPGTPLVVPQGQGALGQEPTSKPRLMLPWEAIRGTPPNPGPGKGRGDESPALGGVGSDPHPRRQPPPSQHHAQAQAHAEAQVQSLHQPLQQPACRAAQGSASPGEGLELQGSGVGSRAGDSHRHFNWRGGEECIRLQASGEGTPVQGSEVCSPRLEKRKAPAAEMESQPWLQTEPFDIHGPHMASSNLSTKDGKQHQKTSLEGKFTWGNGALAPCLFSMDDHVGVAEEGGCATGLNDDLKSILMDDLDWPELSSVFDTKDGYLSASSEAQDRHSSPEASDCHLLPRSQSTPALACPIGMPRQGGYLTLFQGTVVAQYSCSPKKMKHA